MNPLCVSHLLSSLVSCAMYLSSNHVVEFLPEVRNQHFCNTCMWNSFALVYKCFRQILAPTFYDVTFLGELWLATSRDFDQSELALDIQLQKTEFLHRKRRGRNSWWELKIVSGGIWRQCPMTSSAHDGLWLVILKRLSNRNSLWINYCIWKI